MMKTESHWCRLVCWLLTLAALVATYGRLSLAASELPPQTGIHTPFMAVLLRDFDAWDSNHDGVLSIEEINHVVVDASVKGDDAAAAASIKLLMRNKKVSLPPLTRKFFADYDEQELRLMSHADHAAVHPADAVNATVDTIATTATTQPAAAASHSPADFDLYFTASKARLSRGGPDPYPGRFILDNTRQGPLGDCFLVSSTSSFAYHDAERFRKLIVPLKTGGYQVRFPTTWPIFVPAPTDGELAISSTTAGDGVWMAVIEQAFGKLRARLHNKPDADDAEGTELIRTGGDSRPTIRALTGHATLRIPFGQNVEDRRANAKKILPELRKQLVASLADHRIITAGLAKRSTATTDQVGTGTPSPVPPNISTNHVYAVLAYDPASDIVEIWNPHGQHFDPSGSPGIKNGYPTDHGRFKLPLTEAFQFFTAFTFELSKPASAATE